MTRIFDRNSVAAELYNEELSSVYNYSDRLYDPSYALARDPEAYEKILKDSVIAHAIEQRLHMVAGKRWSIEPASDVKEDKVAAGVVEQIVKRIQRFSSSRYNLAEAVIRGSAFAYIENEIRFAPIWDDKPRKWWLPTRLKDVDRRRFSAVPRKTPEGKIEIEWRLWNISKGIWIKLTPEQLQGFIRHIYEDKETSLGYGLGLLDRIYFYWYAKTKALTEGLAGLERWAQGWVIAKIDGARNASTGKTNEQLVTNFLKELEKQKSRHILAIEKTDDVQVMDAAGQGHGIVKDMIAYLDANIRIAILGSNLPTSATEGGSFALAEVQERSTEALLEYDREILSETLTDDLIRLIWRMNTRNFSDLGLGSAQMPRFVIQQNVIQDSEKESRIAGHLLSMGMSLKKEEIYNKTGYTMPNIDDEVIEGQKIPTAMPTIIPSF